MAGAIDRKYWQGLVLAALLSLAGLTAVNFFTSGEILSGVVAQLRRAHFYLAVALVVALWLFEGLRTKAILEITGSRIGFWAAFQVQMASNFAAYVTPLASGGPPVETYLLWRQGVPLDRSLAMVSVRLLLTFGFFVVTVPLLLLVGWKVLHLSWPLLAAAVAAVALMLLSFVLFFYFVYRPTLVEKMAWRIMRWLPIGRLRNPEAWTGRIEQEVAKFGHTLSLLLRCGWRSLGFLAGCTVAIWALFFSVAPVLLWGLGYPVPWAAATIRQILLYFLFSYVPLPGASGVAEVGYASLFASLVPSSVLAGFVATWRLLTYYAGVAVGAPMLLRLARAPGVEMGSESPLVKTG
ncbi:MAG: lysylphosphatidylglycerol synthase transmembrane domain-containing protein [Moorellales bacterium]